MMHHCSAMGLNRSNLLTNSCITALGGGEGEIIHKVKVNCFHFNAWLGDTQEAGYVGVISKNLEIL